MSACSVSPRATPSALYPSLRKGRLGIARTFLVICADRSAAPVAEGILPERIPKEPPTLSTDLGIVHYGFR